MEVYRPDWADKAGVAYEGTHHPDKEIAAGETGQPLSLDIPLGERPYLRNPQGRAAAMVIDYASYRAGFAPDRGVMPPRGEEPQSPPRRLREEEIEDIEDN